MKKYLTFRWLSLGLGLVAIVGLTAMNVYSLYALHESTVSSSLERKKSQLVEVSEQVGIRLKQTAGDLYRLNLEELDEAVKGEEPVPDLFHELLAEASRDSLFNEIYFTDGDCRACDGNGPIQKFNKEGERLEWTYDVPEVVTDGIGMARTRMNASINDFEWQFRHFFDTHRSMTVAIINTEERYVIGYLNMLIDDEYLAQRYIAPRLENVFGGREESGLTVWLRNTITNETLTSTDPDLEFRREYEDYSQSFPDLLDDWQLVAAFHENPALEASQSSLYRNLAVLGATVLFLLGALVFMFVTAQRERELAVRQAGFLANVTHELKTPLAVMQAAGENLSDGRVEDKNRLSSYGQHIYNESLRLRRMIEKLLDVAKTDSGKRSLQPVMKDVNELVDKYVGENRQIFESNGVKVRLEKENGLAPVMLDEESFLTVLGNLVENAIKYSNQPYVDIRTVRDKQYVRIDVQDWGPGIPKKDQKYIFDKFFRVEDHMTANTKGHGLGLSIVKDLMELNNGYVTLKSEQGRGATFSLYFPVCEDTDITQNQRLPANGTSKSRTEYSERQ